MFEPNFSLNKYNFSGKHNLWDGLFSRETPSFWCMSSRNLAVWRVNVWGCDVQDDIIGRYWSGSFVNWPLWETCNDLKRGSGFLCFSWTYTNWFLGFQNPIGNKWLPFISAVVYRAAHIFWISAIDGLWRQRSFEGWDSFLSIRKLIIRRYFAWAYDA